MHRSSMLVMRVIVKAGRVGQLGSRKGESVLPRVWTSLAHLRFQPFIDTLSWRDTPRPPSHTPFLRVTHSSLPLSLLILRRRGTIIGRTLLKFVWICVQRMMLHLLHAGRQRLRLLVMVITDLVVVVY